MSCTKQTHGATSQSNALGASPITASQPLITYKYLELTSDGEFCSPIAQTIWRNGEVRALDPSPDERSAWIWSCSSPDNPELRLYKDNKSVLITLQVWGETLISDNGVVRSKFARIIGYDSDDYYYVLYEQGKISVEEAKRVISPGSDRMIQIMIKEQDKFTREEIDFHRQNLNDPDAAYWMACYIDQSPHPQTRRIACLSPATAFYYARDIDRQPHTQTRMAASQDPATAFDYATLIDKHPHPVTRRGACKDPQKAFDYANVVDRKPRSDTRIAACRDPRVAVLYANQVDLRPHPLTRQAACRNPRTAYDYALLVDRGPHDQTRQAACADPEMAMYYAEAIDKRPTSIIQKAVEKYPYWKEAFENFKRNYLAQQRNKRRHYKN